MLRSAISSSAPFLYLAPMQPDSRTDRWAGLFALERRRGDLDIGVSAQSLCLPSAIPRAEEGAAAVEGKANRSCDRSAVTAIAREQDKREGIAPIAAERADIARYVLMSREPERVAKAHCTR